MRTSARVKVAPLAEWGFGPMVSSAQRLEDDIGVEIMARPPRKRMATLAEIRQDQHTCRVCQEILTVRARVAWTVGRGRLHEECLAKALLVSDSGRLTATASRADLTLLPPGGEPGARPAGMDLRVSRSMP